ncbi:hypothetical protein BMF94_1109 [Rhodotorula taiwanensis]|uniref:Rab-GAP TBC domain-containing protein n=1 Tax=Rhodotorula taiwanensis TaxID=741276 RepID=A0A2S5BG96_9BASI|nr:hypothetical protein BMF94_1109 [Rhodotorula taiwanensis]
MPPPIAPVHPLSPPDPSSTPNAATAAHADLYERRHSATDPLFPQSPPLDARSEDMQRSMSQTTRFEPTNEQPAQARTHNGLPPLSTETDSRSPSMRSRAASPLASPSTRSAYASFPEPFEQTTELPSRLAFPKAPHLLPADQLDAVPLSHLVALLQALSRDLDETQASLRAGTAELAALEKLVRDKGASEGEVERVKVRAKTELAEHRAVEEAERGKKGRGGKDEWSIELPTSAEDAVPAKVEADLDIDNLTEAISSNAFDLGFSPKQLSTDAAPGDDPDDGASVRSRPRSLPDRSGATSRNETEAAEATDEVASISSAPLLSGKSASSNKTGRPRHASLSARFVGYIAAGVTPSSSATQAGITSPKKAAIAEPAAPSPDQKRRPRSGSIRSVNSVASSTTSAEKKGYGEWLGGWRWGKSSGAASSLKETQPAEDEDEDDQTRAEALEEQRQAASGEQEDASTPTGSSIHPDSIRPSAATRPDADETSRGRSRSRTGSASSSSHSSTESGGERSRPSSRRTSQTARSTLDTTLPGSPPSTDALPTEGSGSQDSTDDGPAPLEKRLLSPPESPTSTRKRSPGPPPSFRSSSHQATAAAVLSTPLTASTMSLPTSSPSRLGGYGSSGPASPARSPSTDPIGLSEDPEQTGDLPFVVGRGQANVDAAGEDGDGIEVRHRFVPGVPLYSASEDGPTRSTNGKKAADAATGSKEAINRALGISRTSSHSSHSNASGDALNGFLSLPSKLPPLSLARYSPFSQPSLSMPATHVSLSASTASLTASVSASGSPLVAHTAVLAPASSASGAQTMELDTISAEAAPPSLALLKPSYQSAAAAAGVDALEDEDGPMIDRFGFIYDVHTGMALLKESRRRKAGEASAVDKDTSDPIVSALPEGVPAVMTTPQTELEVHPQLDILREAIGLTPTIEAEKTLSPRASPNELPETGISAAALPNDSRPTRLVRAPSSSHASRQPSPAPTGTGPQSMRTLLVQLRTMTDALEQSQQAAWDAFIRRRQAKLAKLKQAQLKDDDGMTGGATLRERDRERRKSLFLAAADESPSDSISQEVWSSENLVGVAQMGTEKKGKKEDWNEFKELVRKGIPIAYRPKIWGECSSANEAREPGVYQELLAQAETDAEAACLKQIDMDCEFSSDALVSCGGSTDNIWKTGHRTFPTNVFFAGNGPGVAKLRNVLVAYSRRDTKVGYCQGMNNLVATLLLTHPAEEDAFWVLNILPSDYYTSHLLVSRADQEVLKDLVDRTLPKLAAHLEDQGVELSAITFGWFLSLFTDCLPIQTLLRVWDLFFIHGTIFLFRIALAILKLHETDLLDCDSAAGLYAMLGQLPAGLWNADRLLKVACDDLASAVKDKVVASLRNKHVKALEAEMGLHEADADL